MQDDVVALFECDRRANARAPEARRRLTAEQYVAVRSTVRHIARATEVHLRAMEVGEPGHSGG